MKTLMLSLTLVLASLFLAAQEANRTPLSTSFRFEVLDLPFGQNGNHVQVIAQDSLGFMWFGSQRGLHRWDGYQFKTYLHNQSDSTSITSNYIESILVTKDGTLWAGSWGNGLDRFEYETETFTHISFTSDDSIYNGINFIADMEEDKEGNIWVATCHGLHRFHPHTGEKASYLHVPGDPHSLSNNVCRNLYTDRTGTLWIGTGFIWDNRPGGGLNRFRPERQNFDTYLHDPGDPSSLSGVEVSAVFEDSKHHFWVGTSGDGLHLMDRATGKFERLQGNSNSTHPLRPAIKTLSSDTHIRFIFEDRQNRLWVGAWGGGIAFFDPETGRVKEHYLDETGEQNIAAEWPWQMFQSQDGTLWTGAHGFQSGNIFKVMETEFSFYPMKQKSNEVYGFEETEDQKLWVSTMSNGLHQLDLNTDVQTFRGNDFLQPARTNMGVMNADTIDPANSPLLNSIVKMVGGEGGRIWMKRNAPTTLIRVHPETGATDLFFHNPKDDNSIAEGKVTDILKDDKGRIWVTTAKGALNEFNKIENNFSSYLYASAPKKNPNQDIQSVMSQTRDGNIWLGGYSFLKLRNLTCNLSSELPNLFLAKFNPDSAKFYFVNVMLPKDFVCEDEEVHTIWEDKHGDVWMGMNSKLIKINPTTLEITIIKGTDLGSTWIQSMVADEKGGLWLFGEKIIYYDLKTGRDFNFGVTPNIYPIFVHDNTAYKASDGKIYFGGKGGFQGFDPKRLSSSIWSHLPKVVIKEIEFLYQPKEKEKEETAPKNILQTSHVFLDHDQNDFSLRFATLAFKHPERNEHEFKLEGYDKQWRAAGLEKKVTYVKVSPGTYTFRVRGASQKGLWGPEKIIHIHIATPWWGTWWAYLTYILLGMVLIWGVYRFQLNRKLEKAEAIRLKELDAVKTRLYTNMTHEFRTPLTVISGMANQIQENPKQWLGDGLNMIQRNTNRLLVLVNQMLELSKLESGKLALKLRQGDIITYLKYMVESVHSLAEGKGIHIHFYAEEDMLLMDFDSDKIQNIMTNLLSNAVKFTPEDGHVYVSVEKKNAMGEGATGLHRPFLQIKVRDTGAGIQEEVLPYVFDRFYQMDDTHTRKNDGSGIGLALVKELVSLMEGEITVKSKVGKETEFVVRLPIKNEAPEWGISKGIPNMTEEVIPPHVEVKNEVSQTPGNGKNGTSYHGVKPRVLLIEDNTDVVAYIASCLGEQYQVQVGKDGQEGIEIAIDNTPDLIITDVMMPLKDGFEVCAELKNDARTSHIPIIMLTAKADLESKLEGLEKGADAYLAKPFNKAELQVRIKKLLELRKKLQAYYLSVAGFVQNGSTEKNCPNASSIEHQFVEKLKEVVTANLHNHDFNVGQLCKEIGMSHSQLHRKVTAVTGLSPNKFIRHVRLSKAKVILQNPEVSITAVAYDSGFNDPSYFSRVFKKEFGMTPVEWKERG